MDTLLTNAAASLTIGVEDYKSNDPKRALSAVRNFHAGILLLFKEKLRRMSPPDRDEVLLKQKIQPKKLADGSVTFVGTGKKTVDVQQIRERLSALESHADWKRIERITKARNNIEHYWTDQSAAQLKEVVSDAFAIIGPFMVKELGIEPVDLLGQETWSAMLEEAQAYETQRKECLEALALVNWRTMTLAAAVEFLRCPKCHSDLVRPVEIATTDPAWSSCRCSFCGNRFELSDDLVTEIIAEHLAAEAYIAIKDGGDEPYTFCPHCGAEAYIWEEDMCAVCYETRTYTECLICSAGLDTSEQDYKGLCGYHYNSAMKDD